MFSRRIRFLETSLCLDYSNFLNLLKEEHMKTLIGILEIWRRQSTQLSSLFGFIGCRWVSCSLRCPISRPLRKLFKQSGFLCCLQVKIASSLHSWECAALPHKDQGTVEAHYYFNSQLRETIEELWVFISSSEGFIFPPAGELEGLWKKRSHIVTNCRCTRRKCPWSSVFPSRHAIWSAIWFITPVDLEKAEFG